MEAGRLVGRKLKHRRRSTESPNKRRCKVNASGRSLDSHFPPAMVFGEYTSTRTKSTPAVKILVRSRMILPLSCYRVRTSLFRRTSYLPLAGEPFVAQFTSDVTPVNTVEVFVQVRRDLTTKETRSVLADNPPMPLAPSPTLSLPLLQQQGVSNNARRACVKSIGGGGGGSGGV